MMNDEKIISQYISNLLNELAEENHVGAMHWHKELYKIGKSALPLLCKNMIEFQKLHMRPKHKHAYIVQLGKVVHDIDEQTCKDITIELVYNGLDRPAITCLRSLNEFTHKDFLHYEYNGINIYLKANLLYKNHIHKHIIRWLSRVEENDLKEIDRFYIMDKFRNGALGSYTPVFNVIHILWPKFSLATLRKEFTLYHEIGHHVNHHPFGFYNIDHEDEADEYAIKIFNNYHPLRSKVFVPFIKFSRKLFRDNSKRKSFR